MSFFRRNRQFSQISISSLWSPWRPLLISRIRRLPVGARWVIAAQLVIALSTLSCSIDVVVSVTLLMGVLGIGLFIRRRSMLIRRPAKCDEQGGNCTNGEAGQSSIGHHSVDHTGMWLESGIAPSNLLVVGASGSARSEFLLDKLYQALLVGSGAMLVDSDTDGRIYSAVSALCRRMGRESDLLVISLLPEGGRDGSHAISSKRINTCNLFATGSAGQLQALIVDLMGEFAEEGEMLADRAGQLLRTVLGVLCHLRDRGGIALTTEKIRRSLSLDNLRALSTAGLLGDHDTIPHDVLLPLKDYLLRNPAENEQHACLVLLLTKALDRLESTYSHIIDGSSSAVDFKDVVFNRRILFVMLPSAGYAQDRVECLGGLVVSGVRSALTPAVFQESGCRSAVLTRHANIRFLLILNRYSEYCVRGFSIVAAMVRTLGVLSIFADQDLPSFKRRDEQEACSLTANCKIKVIEQPHAAKESVVRAAEKLR